MACITATVNPGSSHMNINGPVSYRAQYSRRNNDLSIRCAQGFGDNDKAIFARSYFVEFIVTILIRSGRGDQLALCFSVYAQTGLRDSSSIRVGYLTF